MAGKKNEDWLTMILLGCGAIIAGIFGVKAIQNAQSSEPTTVAKANHSSGCNKCPFS